MALFSSLSEKFNHIFSKLTKRGRLTELEIKEAMREVRIALLEADVNYLVAKDFVKQVSEKAVGDEVLKSLTPAQQVIKIVKDELVTLMSSNNQKLAISSSPPTIIMMCGLQGAGKTTMCAKLGAYLKKSSKKPLLVGCDIYRPAAINQLQVVGKQANVEVFEKEQTAQAEPHAGVQAELFAFLGGGPLHTQSRQPAGEGGEQNEEDELGVPAHIKIVAGRQQQDPAPAMGKQKIAAGHRRQKNGVLPGIEQHGRKLLLGIFLVWQTV